MIESSYNRLFHADTIISVQRVSPRINFIHPPERLALEVTAVGSFSLPYIVRNGASSIGIDFDIDPTTLLHFGDIYSANPTTTADLGHYIFDYDSVSGRLFNAEIDFFVLEQGKTL